MFTLLVAVVNVVLHAFPAVWTYDHFAAFLANTWRVSVVRFICNMLVGYRDADVTARNITFTMWACYDFFVVTILAE